MLQGATTSHPICVGAKHKGSSFLVFLPLPKNSGFKIMCVICQNILEWAIFNCHSYTARLAFTVVCLSNGIGIVEFLTKLLTPVMVTNGMWVVRLKLSCAFF
jgi:hypothetical protein